MAFELGLEAWSSERTLLREAGFCLVDKAAGIACEPEAGAPSARELPARLRLHGLGAWVPLWTVPARASGATLLAAADLEPERQRAILAERQRAVGQLGAASFTVAVDGWALPGCGRLPLAGGSSLDYRVLGQSGGRALIEARGVLLPEAVLGAFARAGYPVVGAPGAAAATRLMLHVNALGGFEARAPLPVEFEAWRQGAPTLPAAKFSEALRRSGPVRFGLWPRAEAFRLLSEEAGEIAGITLDRYGEHALVAFSNEEAWRLRERVVECVMDHGARGVYVKRRVRADLRGANVEQLAPSRPLRGCAAPVASYVRQGPLGFWVYLGDGLSTGLFLDQRDNWSRVWSGAAGASMLNLFSYTGAFSVAAAAGGARHTTSIDLSARALGRLDQNLALNGLAGGRQRLLKADVPRWLERAARSKREYDWIVLDPPSFGTRGRGVLSTERDYAALVRGALAVLVAGGRVLCVSHHRKISQEALEGLVVRELDVAGRAGRVEPLVGAWDCPSLPGVSTTRSVLATTA